PADRCPSAAESAAGLEGGAARGTGVRTHAVRRPTRPAGRPAALYLVGALALVATAAALLLGLRSRRPAPLPVIRMALDIPDLRVNFIGFYGTSLAVARDGSRMAFV